MNCDQILFEIKKRLVGFFQKEFLDPISYEDNSRYMIPGDHWNICAVYYHGQNNMKSSFSIENGCTMIDLKGYQSTEELTNDLSLILESIKNTSRTSNYSTSDVIQCRCYLSVDRP